VTPLDMVVEARSPHEELNERLRESEQDTFAPDRYAQFARRLRADCEVVLDVGCGMAGVARC